MKLAVITSIALLVSGTLYAADPQEEVKAAAQALAEKENYSWTQKSEYRGAERTFETTATGMTEKDSFTHLSIPREQNTFEILAKGEKRAAKTQEGWQSLSELENATDNQQGRRFIVRLLQNFKAPAQEVEDLVGKVKELKKTDEGYTGELTDEGAKELLPFGRGGGGVQAVSAKGSVTFVIKDGVLDKYRYEVEGTVRADNQDREINRKSEVQIRDIGTTKVVVPEEARIKAQ